MLTTSLARDLDKNELLDVLQLCNKSLEVTSAADLHDAILKFGARIGFDFILYAYMEGAYDRAYQVHFENLSNPVPWMQEYDARGYVEFDPVRVELERRLARGDVRGFIHWDHYDRPVSAIEEEIIERRRRYGLEYGCSVYENSTRQDSVFLVSFASAGKKVDQRTRLMTQLVVPHLNRCRKRLAVRALVDELTPRERTVGEWLLRGKTNWEIAKIMGIAQRTAKFHVANLLSKLQVANRQQAVAILMAEKYLA